MKKLSGIILLVFTLCLAACHHGHCAEKSIVASTFPVYLLTANICAGVPNVSVSLLIPAQAGCPHDFAPRPADLRKLENADILVINGYGLEDFISDALKDLPRKPAIITAGLNVPVLSYSDEEGEINPHIFASPAAAALMARNIARGLSVLDPPNAGAYARNSGKYTLQLEKLSKRLAEIGAKAKNSKTFIEHDALAYLLRNAGFDIVGHIESSASASQLATARKLIAEEKPAFLAGDSQYPDRLLKTLAKEADSPFIVLDPCSNGPENPPLDYYEKVMTKNAEILEAAIE